MAPVVRTRSEAARWIAIQTLFTVSIVVPATALAGLWLCGGDLSHPFSGAELLRFSLALSLIETLLFTPVVAIRSVETLRQLYLARDELDRLAAVDPLTGLLNRRGFEKAAAELLEAGESPPAAALLCDLDSFKQINDVFGHAFGDIALRRVGVLLRDSAEGLDVALGRYGGEEFVVLMVGVDARAAETFAESLRAAIAARPVEWKGARADITVSVGVATTSAWRGDCADLIGAADAALYEAKSNGRNRVIVARRTLAAAA